MMRRRDQMVYLYAFLIWGSLAILFEMANDIAHIDIEDFVIASLVFGLGSLLFSRFMHYVSR